MSYKNQVILEPIAENKFLTKIGRKAGKYFPLRWEAFEFMLGKIELLLLKKENNTITDNGNILLCKLYFKSEQNKSAKDSGSRCIVTWHKEERIVKILLVYTKDHIKNSNETVWWKKMIKDNYPEYHELVGRI